MKNPDAAKYDRLSYIDALNSRLRVMDSTAISLCMDNDADCGSNLWKKMRLTSYCMAKTSGHLLRKGCHGPEPLDIQIHPKQAIPVVEN